MNVLVTGGAGYIGSHAVKSLLKNGHTVVVVDDLSHGFRNAVDPRAIFFEMNINEAEALKLILDKHSIEIVLHFAAFIEVGESVLDPYKYYSNNFSSGVSLLNTISQSNVKKLVFSSTAAVYGNPLYVPIDEGHIKSPISPYGRSKFMMEMAIEDFSKAHGIGYAILRYFNVAGAAPDASIGEAHEPESHLIPRILKAAILESPEVSIYGTDYKTKDGTCVRDYVHVEDLVNAHLLAMEAIRPPAGEIFNIGSERGFTVLEVLEACERATGKKIRSKSESRRAGDADSLVASSQKIRQVLNWTPQFPDLSTIVNHAWAWHQKISKYP